MSGRPAGSSVSAIRKEDARTLQESALFGLNRGAWPLVSLCRPLPGGGQGG
ncbi:hypothetical protein FB465_5602 [Kitasatospora atroaurantiaca]|uniref:Uncharacterized protein n=1 Tax=Kitasatospora atroaurantiaca TaxID=285545 RepID=A0A561EXW1_9ACTN|nr:hypothetical protein FB465_5602 [Kitasatospora atroaurantiaca]